MSYSWRTKADVVNDLVSVNGRHTGAEHLDRHVVEGERPPPIHHEVPDEDEVNYFYGRNRGAMDSAAEPDLAGISVMLRMVKNMDESENEPITLYRKRDTDEIRISKLNPLAGEYVPSNGVVPSPRTPKKKAKANENIHKFQNIKPLPSMFRRREKKTEESNTNINQPSNENVLRNHISRMKSNLLTNGLPQPKTDELDIADDASPIKQNGTKDIVQSKSDSPTETNTDESEAMSLSTSNSPKPKLLPNGLPKRKIDKSLSDSSSSLSMTNKEHEIRAIQEKLKSTIIASSKDNSIQTKRQKNVAIATLLKLGSIPPVTQEKPVKLIKPEYYENPPEKETPNKNLVEEETLFKNQVKNETLFKNQVENETLFKNQVKNETLFKNQVENEHMPSSSSSEMDVHIEPDPISKVNGWFNDMESPKPKPQPEPIVIKQSVTFKKKDNASVNSRSTESSKETKESTKEPEKKAKAYKPSPQARDLLKIYESNAERAPRLKEDLGTMLERMLKEKDEVVKQKMLARQNAG